MQRLRGKGSEGKGEIPAADPGPSAAPPKSPPTQSIKGKLVTGKRGEISGHQVVVEVVERTPVLEGAQVAVWRPTERRFPVSADGSFTVELPMKESLRDPVSVSVFAPDGEVLGRKEYTVRGLGGETWSMNIEPKEYFGVEKAQDRFLGMRMKVTGRVLDSTGRHRPADRQVIVYARPKGAAADAFRVVVAARTDRNGYFSAEYPRGDFVDAYGVISDAREEKVPVPLDEGALPRSLVLVAEVKEVPKSGSFPAEDGCACDVVDVPRGADAVDLVASPSSFSQDAGGGKCVDFTAPNRTLEEFDFYSVIRTTDPEIKGLTLDSGPRIPPGLVGSILGTLKFGLTEGGAGAESKMSMLTGRSDFEADGGRSVAGTGVKVSAADFRPRPGIGGAGGVVLERPATPEPEEVELTGRALDPQLLKSIAADPEAFTPTALMTVDRLTAFKDLGIFLDVLKKKHAGRGTLNTANPVDWDETPTFYQATTIAHGHLLHFKQAWRADGYSMGDLLYSLPLAPCQKKQIAIIDWDRKESAARVEALTEEERVQAFLSRDRDISEIVNSTLRESVEGGSSADTSSFAGGIGIGAILGPVGALLGIGGGSSSASSSAWQDSSRALAASMLNQLHDRTMQSASAVRSQRSTVIQTVRQGESVHAQTEVVANHNHCHAVTTEYFEVLRHFLVTNELADVQECLFLPLLISPFDRHKATRWREPLRRWIRDRQLRRGFEAVERILNFYVGSDLPLGRYAQESLEHIEGEMKMTFYIARPRDDDKGDFFASQWLWIGRLLPWINAAEFHQNYLKDQKEKDRMFQEQLGPKIAENLVKQLRVYAVTNSGTQVALPIDATLASSFSPRVPLTVTLRVRGTVPALKREDIRYIRISTKVPFLGFEIPLADLLPGNSKVIVNSGTMRYRTKYMEHPLFQDAYIANDLTGSDDVWIDTPLSRTEMRNPREEDKELSKRLIAHLNEHLEYYHRCIWMSMDPNRRYMLLDGFVAPNSNGRSVASVVENRVIGIVGNSLVMPVARGFHLDPTYRQDLDNPVDLLNLYAPNTPVPPMRISVPTRGVFAESVMGSCNSCEIKDDSRFWRFEESPCGDEPTAISPLSTESRRADPGNLQAKDFPSPIVAIQNAPAAPDPTGLTAAFSLLGTPGIFKDITGLSENQKNALAALQGAFETAKFFGGEASKLTQVAANQQALDKTLQTVQRAQRAGLISEEDAKSLARTALQNSIQQPRPNEASLTENPTVKSAIDSASTSERSAVSIDRSGSGAESVRVERGSPGVGGGFDFNVPGLVPEVQQPTSMTCWAASYTMLRSWLDQTSYSIETAMDELGGAYRTMFDSNLGLQPAEIPAFMRDAGLEGEAPMSYTPRGLLELLQRHGPLWVVTDEDTTAGFALHARVIVGMAGDGTADGTRVKVIDPATGVRYTESFAFFARKFEEYARDAPADWPLFLQILHYPAGSRP